jgi:hypothetical protein
MGNFMLEPIALVARRHSVAYMFWCLKGGALKVAVVE